MGRMVLLLLMTMVAEARAGVEVWADPRLKEQGGLYAWYDASRQREGRTAKGNAPAVPGGAINLLYDSSGHGRHLVQRDRPEQPKFHVYDGVAVIRFDGKDDHLALLGGGGSAESLTVFLVVAPRSNAGGFRGLLAGNETGLRDYDTGFCIDLAPAPSSRLDAINVEGKGFQGAVDLLSETLPFGRPYVVEARIGTGAGGVSLWVDGRFQGRRDRREGVLKLDDLTLGARFYTNDLQPAFSQGFFDGDLAEVLVYDHVLSNASSQSVRDYLKSKYAGLGELLKHSREQEGEPLQSVANPPPVQMFVPGFATRELPVQLTNINNVRYRHDGKLVALAYSGNIYLLSDRNGDGLEEDVKLFWNGRGKLRAPVGMALSRPGDPRGNGVYVASRGKCSLIVDSNGDDVGDREIIVADGWEEIKAGVDATGVAVAPDGSVYFGLGTADFTNAYLLDRQGQAHYDLKSERGTILKVAPDFKSRERLVTGIRFPVALAFNRNGDLFATDQEGATWLPNGNPFDELLHIQAGRHYGFPPRHAKHLKGVVDEPSVFDYGPQHQSTCGLVFNEPTGKGAVFGPAWWEGDALVCGYSRGKLFRTKLVDSAVGYVARTDLIAALNQLTADACVAPDGALVVATHGGGPDWGSGPEGMGKLFKILYVDRTIAQPVAVWAESERETRVAFDRPVEPSFLQGLAEKATITSGRAVAAGDRFESIRPGYEVVAAQLAAPRSRVKVQSVSMTPDRRTLVFATSPQVEAVSYAMALPGVGGLPTAAPAGSLPEEKAVDLAYGLCGVEAVWTGDKAGKRWSGWLPHLDLKVARELTKGSAGHDLLWAQISQPGTLTLKTNLNLRDWLRAAYQPGSRLEDALLPDELVTLALEADGPLTVRSALGKEESSKTEGEVHRRAYAFHPKMGEYALVEVSLKTGGERPPRLEASVHTNEDPRPRALPLCRILMPWARSSAAPAAPAASMARVVPEEWKGGSWLKGREVFFGEQARCSVCHSVRGQGGTVGPDLSNLVERDYASVVRDIREPNFAINPDHLSYAVALNDGRVLTGPIRDQGKTLLVGDSQGRFTSVPRDDVEEIKPSNTSLMPEGLPTTLGPDRMKDLLAFLLQPNLEPTTIRREGAPPPRTNKEVETLIPPPLPKDSKPLRMVLVAGPKDHGVDEHDYPLWQTRWTSLLGFAPGVTVGQAQGWPSADDFAHADVLVWYSANPEWSAEKGKELDAFLERGGGMVYLHFAVNGKNAPKELADRIGFAWGDGRSRYRHGPLDLDFTGASHSITQGLSRLHFVDESYWDLVGDASKVHVLATGIEEGKPRPLIWTREQGRGRVFSSILGHYSWTFDDPLFRLLVLRGIAWSSHEPVDRLSELAIVGASVEGANPKASPSP